MFTVARQYLAYVFLRILICVVQSLSLEACDTMAKALGGLCDGRIRRRITDENLRLAFPRMSDAQRKRLRRQMWDHLFLFICEIAHAPRKVHDTNWRRHIRTINQRDFIAALLSDRPTLIISAHFGNFELAGYALGVLGFPTHTVARTLDNPFMDRYLNDFRAAKGQHMVPKKGGYDQIIAVLARSGVMTFLADQYAGSKGCWIDFLGRPASAHKAIALFALDNDATIHVGGARRMGKPLQYELEIFGGLDPRELSDERGSIPGMTQWYTDRIADMVMSAPSQYWWLHDRWKDRRKAHRQNRKVAA